MWKKVMLYIAVQNLYSYFILKQGKPEKATFSKTAKNLRKINLERKNSVNCTLEHTCRNWK